MLPARHKREAGFTLVELLVVLVIIGLMASAVVMTLPPEKPALEAQMQTLSVQMRIAAEDAILTGRPHAFGVSEKSFGFFDFQANEWQLVADSPWPDDVRFALFKDAVKVKPGEKLVPTVLFEPTGLSTPFRLSVEDGQAAVELGSAGDGQIRFETGS